MSVYGPRLGLERGEAVLDTLVVDPRDGGGVCQVGQAEPSWHEHLS